VPFTIRCVTKEDEAFLWEMLYYAAHMDEGDESPESAKTNPDLSPYVANWGADGDVGVVAVEGGHPLGAAWARRMPRGSPLYRFVDPTFPELAVAVRPDAIGRGVGTRMLSRLLSAARATHPGMVLSVRADNPARRLYERLGFVTVASMTNRVGGVSLVMKADFP
jgi:GNAT superfamily N-acetyltransferase